MKNLLFLLLSLLAITACTASAAAPIVNNQVTIAGDSYLLLENVKLVKDPNWQRVPRANVELDQQPVSDNLNISKNLNKSTDEQPIARFGNQMLVTDNAVVAQSNNKPPKKQLFVQRQDKVYIVNGEVFAKIDNRVIAQDIAKDYSIKYVIFLEHRNLALFEIPISNQLFDLVNRMEQDQRMQDVKLRLIDDIVIAN